MIANKPMEDARLTLRGGQGILESNRLLLPELIILTIAKYKCAILSIYPLNLVAAKIAWLDQQAEAWKKNLPKPYCTEEEETFQLN